VLGAYAALRGGTPVPESPAPTHTPTPGSTPAFEGCAYVWAYEDLPEISAQVDRAVKLSLPNAEAHAVAFGEDCVFADGHSVFSAMQTDFYVRVLVANLEDEDALGDHMAAILQVITTDFPTASLAGPLEGLVEFQFEDAAGTRVVVRVPLGRYRTEAHGLAGAELYRHFR
jgi:hypothetical protein